MKYYIAILVLALSGCGGGGGGETPVDGGTGQPNQIPNSISGQIFPTPIDGQLSLVSDSGLVNRVIPIDGDTYSLSGDFPAGGYTLSLQHRGLAEHDGTVSKGGFMQVSFEYPQTSFVNMSPYSAIASTGDINGFAKYLGQNPVSESHTDLHKLQVSALSILALSYDSDTQTFVELLIQDLSADGWLDGKGQFGYNLAVDGTLITDDLLRIELPQSFIQATKIAQSPTNYFGDQAVRTANEMANSDSSIIPPLFEPITIEDDTGPIGSFSYEFSISTGDVLSGFETAVITSSDIESIESVKIQHGENVIALAYNTNSSLDVSFDTTQLAEGSAELELIIQLANGATISELLQVTINNTAPTMTLGSATITSDSSYTVSIDVQGDLTGLDMVLIGGVNAAQNGDSFSVSTNLILGVNSIQATLVFDGRESISTTFDVTYDPLAPQMSMVYHEYVSGYKVSTYRENGDIIEQRFLAPSGQTFALTDGSTALDSVQANFDALTSHGYVFLQGHINDTMSDPGDLDVKYTITLEGQILAQDVPLALSHEGEFILPITTEYFGQSLKTVSIDQQFTVRIIAEDEAGNSAATTNYFYVKFANYEINESVSYNNGGTVKGSIVYVPTGYFPDAERVTLIINGQRVDAIDPNSPSFNIDTTLLPSGSLTFTIEVLTTFGEIYSQDLNLLIDNDAPIFDIPSVIEAGGRDHVFSGTIVDASDITSYYVNGEYKQVTSDDGSFSFTIRLDYGINTITLQATDSMGNVGTKEIRTTYDPNKPQFGLISPFNGDQTVWKSNGENPASLTNFRLGTSETYLLNSANKSYSGLALTEQNLIDNHIPFVKFTAMDQQVDLSFENPTVQYQIMKNGVRIQSLATLNPTSGFEYLLPLTSEFFGNGLDGAIETDTFKLDIILSHDGVQTVYTNNLTLRDSTPVISNLLTDSDVFSGSLSTISFTGTGIAGLTSSKLVINGTEYSAVDPHTLAFTPDLSLLPEGLHSANLILENRIETVSDIEMQFTIDRTGPSMTNDLPSMTGELNLLVSGTISDLHSEIARLMIDGNEVMFDSITGEYSHSIEIDPEAGRQQNVKNYDSEHEFIITDTAGNSTTITETIIVDRMGGFVWNQGVNVTGHSDTQCDGTISTGSSWHGGDNEAAWIVYANTKTLNGTEITDDAGLNSKSIGYYRFWTWGHVHEYFGILNTLTDVTYSYSVEGQDVIIDRPLASVGLLGDKQVNEFRIALTEEFLGANFYKTASNDTHQVIVKHTDTQGNISTKGFNFNVCNYVDLGISKN